jgi:hypothetical protein
MSNRDYTKFFLRDRWVANDAPAGGSAAAATAPAGLLPTQRPELETLWYSIWNSNACATVQVQVRYASAAGTLIAAVDHQVLTSTSATASLPGLGIPGKRGVKFWVGMNTAVASLTTKVNIAGWSADENG